MKPNPKNHLARFILSAIAAPVALVFTVSHLHAAALTWDTTMSADSTITAGDGTWQNGSGNWNDGATSLGVNWNNATPDTYAITVASGKSATIGTHVTLNRTAAYSVTGGGSLNITGTGAALTTGTVVTTVSGSKVVVGTGGTFSGQTSIVIGDSTSAAELEVNGGAVVTIQVIQKNEGWKSVAVPESVGKLFHL